MKKVSGQISKTMVFNVVYIVGLVATLSLNYFGYDQFTPDPLVAGPIATLVIALVNLLLRKYATSEPLA